MCTFTSDLPSDERGGANKAYITLFLKPNDPNNEKEAYRFRILNFRSQSKNDRKFPFISRYVHNHWGVNDKGMRVVDEAVVCPSSPFIDARNDMSLGFVDTFKELKLREQKPVWENVCPVCKHVGEAWNAWKSSGKTDKLALERIGAMKKQFQGIIPVYVVNDPNNEKNNGRFKCIVLSDKDDYKRLIDLVQTEMAKIRAGGGKYNWCNGENAVDFFIRMEKLPITYKNGKSGFVRKITRMGFGQKAYDLKDQGGKPVVTKEAIDRFEFDDQYYVKNTKTELEDFYKKYFSFATSNVPDEDIGGISDAPAPAATPAPAEKVTIPTNEAVQKPQAPVEILNDLATDPDDIPLEDGPAEAPTANTREPTTEELLRQLEFDD